MGAARGAIFFRPQERAIVLVVVFTIVLLIEWYFDTGEGVKRRNWVDFVFGTVASGIMGLASALSPLWRVLAGLLVVFPLDQAPDVLLGRPDAWKANDIAVGLMVNALLTWMLPYLDPPALVQRWIANARSRRAAILKKSSVYVAYGIWLFVVFIATAFVAWSLTLLAGYDTSGGEDAELLLGFAAFVTFVTVLFLSIWLFVRFLRRGKTSNAFTNPPAFVQRWVANAQSRLGSILRNGVVYIGYVVSLSVAFAAIISVLAVAKEIITILAGQAPEFEGWTVMDRIVLAASTISIIGLATLLFLARNTSRGELRRRLWRSFTWSLIITACNSGMSAALVICHSYDLLNKPSPWTKALFGEMFELLAQSPALFAARRSCWFRGNQRYADTLCLWGGLAGG